MTAFIKIAFFFLIINVILGAMIDILNSDPISNPNTTIFQGFSSTNGTSRMNLNAPNVTAFHPAQFTPYNETGQPIDPITQLFAGFQQWYDNINFLNTSQPLDFLRMFNVFATIDVINVFSDRIGIPLNQPMMAAFGVILTFTAIAWFFLIMFNKVSI